MSNRIVFGRIKFNIDGINYRFELKKDGLHVRELHHRQVWLVKPEHLLRLTQPQTELFVIKQDEKVAASNPSQPLPNLQEGQLVPDKPVSLPMHEGQGE